MPVVVLGMHRSGTSVSGLMLDALGFYFGPQDQTRRTQVQNPKGYWERKDVVQLNDLALAAGGAQWDTVGHWNPSALPEEFLRTFDRHAGEIVAECEKQSPWFVKDPRMCVTLPLWEKHFKNPVYLIVYRDPTEVAQSLLSRDRLPHKVGFELWERHLGDALNFTQGKPRVLLRYAELLQAPEAAIAQLGRDLKRFGVEIPRPRTAAELATLFDSTLRHHRKGSVPLGSPLTPSQQELIRRFEDGSILDQSGPIDLSAANRGLCAFEAAIETGELPPREEEAAVGDGTLLRELTGLEGEVREALEKGNLLELYLERVESGNRAALAAYETELLKLRGQLDKKEEAIVLLAGLCERLSPGNWLAAPFRKARRQFRQWKARQVRQEEKPVSSASSLKALKRELEQKRASGLNIAPRVAASQKALRDLLARLARVRSEVEGRD